MVTDPASRQAPSIATAVGAGLILTVLLGVAPRGLAQASPPGGGGAPAVLVEAALSSGRIYAGAQTVYTMRLLRRVALSGVRVAWPWPLQGAYVVSLGTARARLERRQGHRYRVSEWRVAIIAARAGELLLPPVTVRAVSGQGATRAPVVAVGPVLHLRVLPPPPVQPPWLPAQSMTLDESWSRPLGGLSPGDVVVREIVLRARGLRGSALPVLHMSPVPGLSVFHDQPEIRTMGTPSGVHGLRRQRVVLVAEKAGSVEIPSLTVQWWDLARDAGALASLPARQLHAAAGPSLRRNPAHGKVQQSRRRFPLALWVAAAVAVLTLATLAWWWLWRGPRQRQRQLRAARAAALRACARGSGAEARRAVMRWAEVAWPDTVPATASKICARADVPGLASALAELDASLYRKARVQWRGAALAKCVRAARPPPQIHWLDQPGAAESTSSRAPTSRSTSSRVL